VQEESRPFIPNRRGSGSANSEDLVLWRKIFDYITGGHAATVSKKALRQTVLNLFGTVYWADQTNEGPMSFDDFMVSVDQWDASTSYSALTWAKHYLKCDNYEAVLAEAAQKQLFP
jgi:hypothetical protein